jgi:hypothetical protein
MLMIICFLLCAVFMLLLLLAVASLREMLKTAGET